MQNASLRPVIEVSVADWIAQRMGPFGGRVGSVAPRGFDSYVRVLHPARDADGQPASWADVCAVTGRHPHGLMQWDAIANAPNAASGRSATHAIRWNGRPPDMGNLDINVLATLCQVLDRHTEPGAECFLALWDGYGWIRGSPSIAAFTPVPRRPVRPGRLLTQQRRSVPPAFPEEIIRGPRLRLPGRDYILLTGALRAATTIADQAGFPQAPNLLWPADTSWCVATEIDFDSTIVAGTKELVTAMIAEPSLDAWAVDPDDSLAHDGDTINT